MGDLQVRRLAVDGEDRHALRQNRRCVIGDRRIRDLRLRIDMVSPLYWTNIDTLEDIFVKGLVPWRPMAVFVGAAAACVLTGEIVLRRQDI